MKRILSLVVCICMVVSLLPANVMAAPQSGGEHAHCDCVYALSGKAADKCTAHNDAQSWQEWNDSTKLPTTTGYYYLSVDVTLTSQMEIGKSAAANVHICTNGHDITSTVAAAATFGILRVYKGSNLTITNCQATVVDGLLDTTDPDKTSTLSGAVTTATSGGMIQAYQGVDLNIWGVEFKNNETRGNHDTWSGGAILAVGNNGTDVQTINIAYSAFTGNHATQKGGGIYLEKAGYDGESYVSSVFKIGGKMLVAENKDTDLFISEGTLVNVSSKGLSDGTNIGVTLQSGTLTRTVIGAYDYEGGNLNYVVTAGDRSITDPEPVPQTESPEDVTSLIWIPIAVVLVILVAGGVILLLTKKKKSQK